MENGFSKTSVLGLDWNDLKFFLAVARAGSLTGAAQLLESSPATVSRHVDALEQRLGITLFIRHQTGYALTDEGQDALDAIGSVEQAMLSIQRRSDGAGAQRNLRGKVRLATTDGLASMLIVPHLHEFWRKHPDLHVELLTQLSAVSLTRREADLALRYVSPADQPEGQDYIGINLGSMRFSAFYSRAHLGKRKADAVLLAGELDYIAWNEDWSILPQSTWMQKIVGDKSPLLTSNNLIVHYFAARAGVGMAMLPDYIGDADDTLCKLATPEPLAMSRDVWLVYHRDLKTSQRVIAMRDFLKELVLRKMGAAK